MFHNILDLLHRRHFWRYVRFSELSELYMSLTLRSLGLSLVSIFIPVFLFLQGFSFADIALLFMVAYGLRLIIDPLVGLLIARYGPKKILSFSYIMEIVFLSLLLDVGHHGINFWILAVVFSFTVSVFWIPFMVDFAAIRSARHIGHQLGVLNILERLAGAIGPLAGGLVATIFGFGYAVLAAMVVIAAAAIPLLPSKEEKPYRPVRYRPSIAVYKEAYQHIGSFIGRSTDETASTLLWPLFVGAILLSREDAYAGVGLVTAIGMLAALFSAYAFGKIVDNHKGRQLLQFGTIVSFLIHGLRSFATSLPAASAISAIGDSAATSVAMPFSKGWYDRIESSRSGPISYMIASVSIMHLTRVVLWGLFYILLAYAAPLMAFQMMFVICAMLTLLTMAERFEALNR